MVDGRKTCTKRELLSLIGRREAGLVIPAKDDRALEGGKRATPPDSAQQGVPVRPAVVGAFLTSLRA